jgi:hypothetical protein
VLKYWPSPEVGPLPGDQLMNDVLRQGAGPMLT